MQYEFLEPKQLSCVIGAPNRHNLVISCAVDHQAERITFMRGDLKQVTVPFSAFQPSGDGTKPDFNKLSIIDYGQTVKLGNYEAATDAILANPR